MINILCQLITFFHTRADHEPRSARGGLRRRQDHGREVLDCEELVGRALGRGRLLQDQEGNRRVFPRVHGRSGDRHSLRWGNRLNEAREETFELIMQL